MAAPPANGAAVKRIPGRSRPCSCVSRPIAAKRTMHAMSPAEARTMLAVDCRGAIAEVFTNQAYVPPRHFLATVGAMGDSEEW